MLDPKRNLTSPILLNQYRAFTKIIKKANDPAFKQVWRDKRTAVLNKAKEISNDILTKQTGAKEKV